MAWLLVLIVQVGHEDFCAAPNSSTVLYIHDVRRRFNRSLQGLDLGGAEWVRISSNILAGRKMLACDSQPLGFKSVVLSWHGVKMQLKCVSWMAGCAFLCAV